MTDYVPMSDIAAVAVETLLDHAFGRDRHQRTAYRVRGNGAPIAALSFAAIEGGALVGTIQCWPIVLATDAGARVPLVMVGPVAVEPHWQQGGIGRALMTHALAAARPGRDAAPARARIGRARGGRDAGAGVALYLPPRPAYLRPMPMDPIPDLATLSLAEIARLAADAKLPPVDQWDPAHCGDSEMRIARDGTWYHQGSPIGREAMVRLFSTILRREPDGRHVLVTPVEKLDIAVDDAPFLAVEMKAEGEGRAARLAFRLNTGDLVTAGPDHPLRFVDGDDGPRPYLHVRGRLEALVARAVYYELAERAIAGDEREPGVWSDGAFFAWRP